MESALSSAVSPRPTASVSREESHRKFMFLCGVPRSGTTALCRLMNLHPQVSIGVERFKNLAMSGATEQQFTPALFTPERFFAFEPGDTNVRADSTYKSLRAKYQKASFVGDKVPRFYTKFKALTERFEDPVIIYILRDLASVARSWNARADDPADRWPSENDYTKAVAEWNRANKLALRQMKLTPKNLIVVAYEDLFPFGIHLIVPLFDRLGLDLDRTFLSRYRAFCIHRGPSGGKSVDRDGQDAYLAQHADMATFEKLHKRRFH